MEKFRGTDRCLGEIGAAPMPHHGVLTWQRDVPVRVPAAALRCDRGAGLGARHSGGIRTPPATHARVPVPRLSVAQPCGKRSDVGSNFFGGSEPNRPVCVGIPL